MSKQEAGELSSDRMRAERVASVLECVRATFFLIGQPASEHPDLVRRIAAEGHPIGHHLVASQPDADQTE